MRYLLRCQTSLRQKLLRSTFCNVSFARFRQTGTGFSGPPPTEPFVGEYRPLGSDWNREVQEQLIPGEVDIAIIGGGLVGLCAALFVKHRFPRSFTITVIEKDPLVRFLQCACVYMWYFSGLHFALILLLL